MDVVGQPRPDAPLEDQPPAADHHPPQPGRAGSRTAAVPLRRLLGLATLTAPQAAHIAIEVLAGLQDDSGSYGAFDAEDVLVGDDGTIRLADRDRPFTPGTASAASELVHQLARNADRPAAHRRPENAELLAAMARCSTQLTGGDLDSPRDELRRELDATGANRTQLARELAALVAVPLVRVGAEPGAEQAAEPDAKPAGAPAAEPAKAAAVPIVVPDAPVDAEAMPIPPDVVGPNFLGTLAPRRRLVATVIVVVLAVAALITALVLDESSGNSPAATHSSRPPHSGSQPAHKAHGRHAAGHPRAVPKLAPATARGVSAVTLHPTRACKRGATCEVTVRIHLRPPGLSSLTWHAVAINRCTGARHRIDHGSMIAEPGWRSAYATVPMRLPHERSMAVVAVLDSPVSAASKPLLVPAHGGSCLRQ